MENLPPIPTEMDEKTTAEIAQLSNELLLSNDGKMMELTQGKLQKLRALIAVASDTSCATLALDLPVTDENLLLCCSQSGDAASLKGMLAKNKGELTLFNEAFVASCEFGHVSTLFELLNTESDRIDTAFENSKSLRMACKNGQASIVNFLLQDPRIDPTAFDQFAVRVACENGHTQVVKILLKDKRVNPSAQNNYAVVAATKNGHTDVLKVLLEDPRIDPTPAFLNALSFRRTDLLQLLIADSRVKPNDLLESIYSAMAVLKNVGHQDYVEELYGLLKIPKQVEKEETATEDERNAALERRLKSMFFSTINAAPSSSSSETTSSEEEEEELDDAEFGSDHK